MRTDEELREFRAEVMFNTLWQGFPITVVNDAGELPVVACLDREPLAVLLDRVGAAGGYATVFSKGNEDKSGRYSVRRAAFINADCALDTHATDMTDEAPARNAQVGMFLDYLETQPGGVIIPRSLGVRADVVERPIPVEFQPA